MFKAVALYILEYLFKTRAGGYFIALSGGSDSTLNALFIYFACQTLAYFAYQAPNHEIIQKISYIIGLPITLKKVSLSEKEQKETLFITGKQILENSNDFILSEKIPNTQEDDILQYFIGDDTPISFESMSNKILNVAYLPMDFSGVTKPFVENLKKSLNCNFVEFSIQKPFNAFKNEIESVFQK
jgi:NH3-dependent NAD+ synthetase